MDLSFGLRFQYVNVFLRICILQECKPQKMDTSTTQTVLACGPWWLVLYHVLCSQGIAMWVWESLKLHWLILRPLPRKAGCGDRRCRSWKWPNESTNSTFCCFLAHGWLRNCFYIGFSLEVWILEAIDKKRDEWYQAEFKLIHIHRYLRYPWGRYGWKLPWFYTHYTCWFARWIYIVTSTWPHSEKGPKAFYKSIRILSKKLQSISL